MTDKEIETYHPISRLKTLKVWVAFCLMIFLLAKPVLFVPLGLVGAKYEFFDLQEKENSAEKEIVTVYKIKQIFNFNELFSQDYQRQLISWGFTQFSLLNLTIDIHLPPPKF